MLKKIVDKVLFGTIVLAIPATIMGAGYGVLVATWAIFGG